METIRIANEMIAMLRQGKFLEAGERFWAEDVLSVEPMTGEMAQLRGKAAAKAKGEWWTRAHDVHGVEIQGPYVNGDQFIVRFIMDLTVRETKQRSKLDELGLYTLRQGKIAEEKFFVTPAYFER
ncbi:MAG: nuclear transport factor 2 family protein [Proteobacteria bacterium]|nr:nuclear transport factor 2 family protein [Pseudomonadota bacterium]